MVHCNEVSELGYWNGREPVSALVCNAPALLLFHLSALASRTIVTHRQVGQPMVGQGLTGGQATQVTHLVVAVVLIPLCIGFIVRLPCFLVVGSRGIRLSKLVTVVIGSGGRGGYRDGRPGCRCGRCGRRGRGGAWAAAGAVRRLRLPVTGRAEIRQDVTEA